MHCFNCGLEVVMGDGGVGGGDSGTDADFAGISADIGLPGVDGPGAQGAAEGMVGITGSEPIGIDGPAVSGPGDHGGGPADTPAVKEAPKPKTPKPAKVAEKKEAVTRKARKRSLLGEENTTVYRRSILGS
jgi:hypothetical protein